jgi:hypothetical protein
MEKNPTMTTDHENTSRKSKSLSKTKHTSQKKNEDLNKSKSDSSKLMALQDALQDPITNCEGF